MVVAIGSHSAFSYQLSTIPRFLSVPRDPLLIIMLFIVLLCHFCLFSRSLPPPWCGLAAGSLFFFGWFVFFGSPLEAKVIVGMKRVLLIAVDANSAMQA